MEADFFVKIDDQMAQIGNCHWHVSRLFELTKDFEVMDIPLDHLNVHYKYEDNTLRQMAGHMIAVNNADLKYPIILDENGDIMDGRHRVMKAIINGEKSIKAVRFGKNPTPCNIEVAE